ncbi:MAG: ASCH domain-containing protein [Pseudonocardiaceae bacterium]
MSGTVSSHQLNIRLPYLRLIADGTKTVEVRVGYPKIRRIQAGHELIFVSGEDTVVTRVKRITEYESFEALLDHEDTISIGGDLGESRDELLAVIREIYPPEKEKLGVLAIQVERA